MALIITEECIGCDACLPVCPTAAITEKDPIYSITREYCTECIIDHWEPQCAAVCPVDSIIRDDEILETYEHLLEKRTAIFSENV